METKSKILALFVTNTDGYITGYQQEFYDGKEWQTPFDTTNAVEVAPGDLDTIVIGATKLIDGQLVLDTSKQAELEAEAN
ncbi:phage infection protein, partial [Lacticaseibacillus paracasei]|uniref:phage infection protein n=1 Tax=Lacticaseibacillus paracasei TaxID=1597 RepID=UPI0021A3031A